MMLIPDEDSLAPGRGVLRLERFVGPYYVFRDAGADVVLASPDGGFPWMGLARDDPSDTDLTKRFNADPISRNELTDTLRLEQIYCEDFDAAFSLGYSGPVWKDPPLAGLLIGTFLQSGKPVASFPSDIDIAPEGVSNGLLIVSDHAASPAIAAQALLGALGLSKS